ncbi:hypothetical protein J3Q09_21800 [Pseudomonas sp. R4-83]|uniref:ORC-CDC6 family AAA ATPase n=1 Tax=unclassified Pseudomonas TaxID=196821 RepID=UPI003DAA08D1
MINKLPEIFSKNRNEETKEDNWSDFVVPGFLNELEIKSQSKAIVIVGGRGTGKTTLLRYFCHATQFSSRRPNLPDNILNHIGLYWRADTNFLNSFAGGEQTPEVWRSAFEHMLACEFGKEIIRALKNLNCNPERQERFGLLESLSISVLRDFDDSLGDTIFELEKSLQRSRTRLAMWVNNLDTCPRPVFLPADAFLRALIGTLKDQLPYLSESTFGIFIDEYENLRDEQQRFINGLLKHGSPPLIYNIALKPKGWHTKQTIGGESIQEISDYRAIDLESYIAKDFDVFAAELLFFRLAEHEPELQNKLPIVPEHLRSIDHIQERYDNPKYREIIVNAAEQMLPRVSLRAAATEVLTDAKLLDRLINKIRFALQRKGSELEAEDFIDIQHPEVSVIMPALLSRDRESADALLKEFIDLKHGTGVRLSSKGALVSNNLFGCINSIYIDARRTSILFSGFTVLTMIARGNVRHLLELIHRIFKEYKPSEDEVLPVVPPYVQAHAIYIASESILNTVSGFGIFGPQLYALVLCLGSIFRQRHRSDKQSEPEINHFTIAGGELSEKLNRYLLEAEKWSVLFLSRETKMKTLGVIASDYTLNPIFSPYFQISYRKKRSLHFNTTQLLQMFEGDQQVRDALVRELGKQDVSEPEQIDLFGEVRYE